MGNENNAVVPGFIFKNENLENNISDKLNFEIDNATNNINNDNIINSIINNNAIRAIGIDIKSEDISINNGMILANIKHENSIESYRFDIIDDELYVQAPLSQKYDNNDVSYSFISVPVKSIVGQNIILYDDYHVNLNSLSNGDINKAIFRITEIAP